MALSPDYYSVLGVPSTASRDTIHAAWKALLRQYHPDANHGVDVSARAKEINEAYAVLGKKRACAHTLPFSDKVDLPETDRTFSIHGMQEEVTY